MLLIFSQFHMALDLMLFSQSLMIMLLCVYEHSAFGEAGNSCGCCRFFVCFPYLEKESSAVRVSSLVVWQKLQFPFQTLVILVPQRSFMRLWLQRLLEGSQIALLLVRSTIFKPIIKQHLAPDSGEHYARFQKEDGELSLWYLYLTC